MHLHFDCASGASGDMILAALVDAGLGFDALREELAHLDIGDYCLRFEQTTRAGIAAARIAVTEPREHAQEQLHGRHRHLADMLRILADSDLPPEVADRACNVFKLLAGAEAKVHGKEPDQVHFHEISGIDSLVDVIGACLGLHLLGVTSVSCSTVTVGTGTVKCAHGELPLPAPATLEILRTRNIPFRQVESGHELLTPTGVALLAVLCDRFGPCPGLQARRIGYGAGAHETPGRPNVLRVIMGEPEPGNTCAVEQETGNDCVAEMRMVMDDMTAEQIAHLLQRCLEHGALDAYATPVTMKKSRLGTELTMLARPQDAAMLQDLVFRESTTFGMRVQNVPRIILDRETMVVNIRGYEVRVKIGSLRGKVVTRQPEFEDCRVMAESLEIPLKEAYRLAARAALELPL